MASSTSISFLCGLIGCGALVTGGEREAEAAFVQSDFQAQQFTPPAGRTHLRQQQQDLNPFRPIAKKVHNLWVKSGVGFQVGDVCVPRNAFGIVQFQHSFFDGNQWGFGNWFEIQWFFVLNGRLMMQILKQPLLPPVVQLRMPDDCEEICFYLDSLGRTDWAAQLRAEKKAALPSLLLSEAATDVEQFQRQAGIDNQQMSPAVSGRISADSSYSNNSRPPSHEQVVPSSNLHIETPEQYMARTSSRSQVVGCQRANFYHGKFFTSKTPFKKGQAMQPSTSPKAVKNDDTRNQSKRKPGPQAVEIVDVPEPEPAEDIPALDVPKEAQSVESDSRPNKLEIKEPKGQDQPPSTKVSTRECHGIGIKDPIAPQSNTQITKSKSVKKQPQLQESSRRQPKEAAKAKQGAEPEATECHKQEELRRAAKDNRGRTKSQRRRRKEEAPAKEAENRCVAEEQAPAEEDAEQKQQKIPASDMSQLVEKSAVQTDFQSSSPKFQQSDTHIVESIPGPTDITQQPPDSDFTITFGGRLSPSSHTKSRWFPRE